MSTVSVGRTRIEAEAGGTVRLSTTVSVGADRFDVWYTHPDRIEPISHNLGDIWFPPALLTAMTTGMPLVMEDAVSTRMIRRAEGIQEVYATWFPGRMHPIEVDVEAPEASSPAPQKAVRLAGRRPLHVASTFTGGVDSFHMLLRNEQRVSHLLYVFGFDFGLEDTVFAATIEALLRDVADDGGTELVLLRTNVRDFMRAAKVSWGGMAHGATIASAGMVIANEIDELLIAASHKYGHLRRWGSSPIVDTAWSTDRVEIFHDGSVANRMDKIAAIQHHPLVHKHLRVCARRLTNRKKINCGTCRKCMMTAAMFSILGSLDRIETFEPALDLDRFRKADLLRTPGIYDQAVSMVQRAGNDPRHRELVRILRRKIRKHRARTAELGA